MKRSLTARTENLFPATTITGVIGSRTFQHHEFGKLRSATERASHSSRAAAEESAGSFQQEPSVVRFRRRLF